MRKSLWVLCACAALALPTVLWADGSMKTEKTEKAAKAEAHMKMKAEKPMTVAGEVVDAGCYISKNATGEKHKECAAKCFANGMPACILDAKGNLWLLTPDHDNGQPYKDALGLAGDKVEVTGTPMKKGGMNALVVTAVKKGA